MMKDSENNTAPSMVGEGGALFDSSINVSGHKQELERNFSLLQMCGVGITTGNVWAAIGGSVAVAIYNGGAPGVIYEFIAVSVCYWFVAVSIAELASAIPSSSGVYHWASVTGGSYGRLCGWFAGWWNFFAWIFGVASISAILGNQTVSMYCIIHPDFEVQAWHVFVSYIISTWLSCLIVLFANRSLPAISSIGLFLIIAGVFITIIVCAAMPAVQGTSYGTNDFVWREWVNQTGYSSNGFVFVAGMLNGAYAVGSTDCITHLAEEIPTPSVNIPKAMLAQYAVGFLTAFLYLIAIFYAVHDMPTALTSIPNFPLAGIYMQATGSRAGAMGLLIVVFLPTFVTCIGVYITAGRTLWTLARDNATPFSKTLRRVHPTMHNPFNATLACGVICTIMGCIYVGSTTAFNAFVGSYVIMSTLSYLAAILPHLLSGRKHITPGWFWMKGGSGFVANTIACSYIVVFILIFCFPYALPISAANMNYSCLIAGGLSLFIVAFWFVRQGNYAGPGILASENRDRICQGKDM